MTKQYINDTNLQTAMAEYDSEMELGHVAKTPNGHRLGTVTYVSANTLGFVEQVYAVVRRDDQTNSIKKHLCYTIR